MRKKMVDARSRNPTPLAARQIYFARDYHGLFAVDAVALALDRIPAAHTQADSSVTRERSRA
jgi:hypothetical protein